MIIFSTIKPEESYFRKELFIMKNSKRVTLTEIANALDFDLTTVCKIINNVSDYQVAEETRELVLKKAKEMGYDCYRLHGIYRRKDKRVKVQVPSKIIIRERKTNKVYNKGTVEIKDISAGGALLTNFNLEKQYLPISAFICELNVMKGILKGCNIIGEPARITNNDEMNLGIRFGYISSECKEKIMSIAS